MAILSLALFMWSVIDWVQLASNWTHEDSATATALALLATIKLAAGAFFLALTIFGKKLRD